MRIGIMRLGRIGSFHAETLSGLDAVDSLVVTDPVAAAIASVAERFGAKAVESPKAVPSADTPHGLFRDRFADAHPAELAAFTQVVASAGSSL